MRLSIIPRPMYEEVKSSNEFFVIDSGVKVNVAGNELAYDELNSFMNKAFGYRLSSNVKGSIHMLIDKALEAELGNEGYLLDVNAESIIIKAAYENGIFYGVETLKQIIVQFITIESASIPLLIIRDKPLYKHRGYMLDVCRHFFSVSDVMKIIDTLSLQKLNVFHWHLTEDQGWRIEIKKYPKLTTIGARRRDTIGDGKWHGGYYTREDIKRVVDYCKSKFITIIPEIDLPGHSMAAAAAYNYLTCKGEPINVSTTFGIKPDIFCAGKDSTYQFLYDVLDEVVEMFPGEYIHLGGDEAPKVRWEECPLCIKAVKDNNLKNAEQLQGHFLNKLTEYLAKKGKKVICWNESIYSEMLDKSVICQYWSDGKVPTRVIREMNKGREGIISKFAPYYLDYPHAMHSLKSVYNFSPELKGLNVDIKGIEAPLWTEYVSDISRIEFMTYPRLTAVGEIGWTDKSLRDYDDFMIRLDSYLKLLDIYNIKYAERKHLNPGLLRKLRQMLQFLGMINTKENRKAMKESAAAVKEMKATRKEIE